MPALPKTTDAEIVRAARQLVEASGRDGFSMSDVARVVGVRAPSLYGRFADRAALIDAVELQLWNALGEALADAPPSRSPVRTLTAQARAYRAFAKANPNGYSLLYAADAARTEEGTRARARVVAIPLGPLAALVGEADAFAAARVLTPFLHGFVSMELAGAFRLGGRLDEAFDRGVAIVLRGLAGPPRPRRGRAVRREERVAGAGARRRA